jgi:hypothetical protein
MKGMACVTGFVETFCFFVNFLSRYENKVDFDPNKIIKQMSSETVQPNLTKYVFSSDGPLSKLYCTAAVNKNRNFFI